MAKKKVKVDPKKVKKEDLQNMFSNVLDWVRVVRDKGVTNSFPLLVRIVFISEPFFLNNLMRSKDL